MRLRLLLIALATAILAVALSSCGSSGDDETSLTKAQFIKQADAICKKADEAQFTGLARAEEELREEENIPDKVTNRQLNTAQQNKMFVNGGLPPVQKEAEEIAALGAPAGDEQEVEAIVAGIEEAVKEVEKSQALKVVETAFDQVDKMSAEYGFKECAEAL